MYSFLFILFGNITLILIFWNRYGSTISRHFIKSSTLIEIESLRKSVEKLKVIELVEMNHLQSLLILSHFHCRSFQKNILHAFKMDQAASKIKKFFAKKKSDAKFKTAGKGVRLDSASSSSSQSQKPKRDDVYVPIKRNDLTEEAKQARDAAMKRILNDNRGKPLNISARAIKDQARKEIEEQQRRKVAESESNLRNNVQIDEKKDYTIDGVYFTCPMISEEVLSKNEWKVKIKAFLYEQFEADPGLTSCLIIKNCNTFDKAEECIETLKKYIANILANPDEPKYQKIRMSNRVFCDKVANVEGSLQFLNAAGFNEGERDEINK